MMDVLRCIFGVIIGTVFVFLIGKEWSDSEK